MRIYGFTVVELLVVIVAIGVLASISVGQFNQSQERGRDSQRTTAVDAIKSQLEEYHQDRGSYPPEVTPTTLTRVNPEFLSDPKGGALLNRAPVADEYDALQYARPTTDFYGIVYTAYPTGCSSCSGFVLKTYLEAVQSESEAEYSVRGAYNN